jgi:hypothetical protein
MDGDAPKNTGPKSGDACTWRGALKTIQDAAAVGSEAATLDEEHMSKNNRVTNMALDLVGGLAAAAGVVAHGAAREARDREHAGDPSNQPEPESSDGEAGLKAGQSATHAAGAVVGGIRGVGEAVGNCISEMVSGAKPPKPSGP